MKAHSCTCTHHAQKNIPLAVHRQVDPTRTLTLRRSFEGQFYKRFRTLKGMINEAIVADDGFGLKTNLGRFDYPRSSDKVAAFMLWLRRAQSQEILGVVEGTPLSTAASQSWASVYIQSAYQQGLSRGAQELRKQGVEVSNAWVDGAFFRPIHADRAGLIYTRTYSELAGITQTMDAQISRILAQGIIEGRGPADLARQINDRVDKIGLTRARALARTEVISAHVNAALNSYEEAGVEGVDVQAEVLTAANPCPICARLERGGPYTLQEARGLIPAHPNCRCTVIPKVIDPQRIRLR